MYAFYRQEIIWKERSSWNDEDYHDHRIDPMISYDHDCLELLKTLDCFNFLGSLDLLET